MKYAVNDEFSALREFALDLPETFDRMGSVIQDNRNVIKKITIEQGTFVVKNFRGMYFLNRLMYSFFRKSKAERSFLYSQILNNNGIVTPPPVAWLDCFQWGLLKESYFVSVYYSYPTFKDILHSNNYKENEAFRSSLLHQLAAFTFKLHRLNIYHKDFSWGNILIIEKPEGFQFALIDLNRIRFGKVNYKKGLRNFITLEVTEEDMNTLIREYAVLSNQSPEESIEFFWTVKKRSSALRRFRKKIRRHTLTPLEQLIADWRGKKAV